MLEVIRQDGITERSDYMGLGIKKLISGAVEPVTNLIDDMHTSTEEKQKLKNAVKQMENSLNSQMIKAKGDIIQTEAESEHFLTATWRPITALVFVTIIANNYILAPYMEAFAGTQVVLEIPPQMWELLKLMIGGYVVGRSGEKMLDKYQKGK